MHINRTSITNSANSLLLSSILFLFVIISFLAVFILVETAPARFEKYIEKYKPVKDFVCDGKATKNQLIGMVKCMKEFKDTFKLPKETKVKYEIFLIRIFFHKKLLLD